MPLLVVILVLRRCFIDCGELLITDGNAKRVDEINLHCLVHNFLIPGPIPGVDG